MGSKKAPANEQRTIRMHPRLLYDVIFRQAGTLAKAILEGVMNSVDAGASLCTITLTEKVLCIVDDGKGISSRQEVETFFEEFGHPHDETEQKKYGQFRMGRGQLFAFGVNIWRTSEFRMDVDIRDKGVDYNLQTGLEDKTGCDVLVTLYKALLPSELAATERDIEEWVKWVPIPVTFNGKLLSKDPEAAKWQLTTDDAYMSLNDSGMLKVYNLGVHVCSYPTYKYGVGGTIVSRSQLKVNFARNDIQSDCKVWEKISKKVEAYAGRVVKSKKSLTDGEREHLAHKLFDGDVSVVDKAVFTAVTGRHFRLHDLLHHGGVDKYITVCRSGDPVGDRIHRSKRAFVLADVTLARFRVESVQALLAGLEPVRARLSLSPLRTPKAFSKLAAEFSDESRLLVETELSSVEQLWVELLATGMHAMPLVSPAEQSAGRYRKIFIGESEVNNGWTDGATYIAIGRKFLKRFEFTVRDLIMVGRVVLHEMCHHTLSAKQHDHDQEFYEEFHDNAGSLGLFVNRILAVLPAAVERHGKRLNKRQLKEQDKLKVIERKTGKPMLVADARAE